MTHVLSQKKICFFIRDISSPAGTERVTCVLANQLVRSGYQVDIITLTTSACYFTLEKGIRIHALGAMNDIRFVLFYPWVIFKLFRLVSEGKYDVFINVTVIMIYASWIVRLISKCRMISWEHYNINIKPRPFISAWSRRLALRLSEKVVLLTRRDEELYRQLFNQSAKIMHIPNPVTIFSAEKADPEQMRVLAIGRYTAQKGFDMLLDAWHIVCAAISGWELHIVGDGEDREMLLQKAEQLNIEHRVRFSPPAADVANIYKKASFYVLSSRFEGMPLVLLEAMHMGLPLVAFDCNYGPAELITPGYNGILVENGSVEALAREMSALITNKEKRIAMSRNALKASEQFSIERITKQWTELFKNLIL